MRSAFVALALIVACIVGGHAQQTGVVNLSKAVPTGLTLDSIEGAPVPKSGRIVGGSAAQRGQFPFMAAIYLNGASFCGGSLIAAQWVLTAAHCAQGVSTFTVYLGASQLNVAENGRIVISTTSKIVHSGYSSSTLNNDIALINLLQNVTFSSYIKPVCLTSVSSSHIGKTIRAPGWGRASEANGASSLMHYTDLTVVAYSACQNIYGSVVGVLTLCAQSSDGYSLCYGHNGGPVIDSTSGCQIGIASFVPRSNCNMSSPIGFTPVSRYISWIVSNTGLSQTPVNDCVCLS